ncbi:MAG: chorismate mutase [Omnitrophica bacterium RIFCSPLOWO2_12_FULL_44_17]|uniref:Bifunctional chorismate mutase/prephenate dehydratase n=1 Tax=Candidatus Danuiimicrobium aquiferis TaxID=1801832 RepID=A0A1G1L1H6_9BACT|nr:MAG: chorismate mutase [Omnitrophica bacterium RIFCSPHIGHO2_02_FULL_45_28]OGW89955.1 MAG: chorismate mutase [Omnitrophica bacterium RIFCSPHIGHO2_12_FULL_44_12]OGW99005.1 MAG: chorismate mutase [Omnitrophica bacterium RIFCSPLOWO2_12_FULL_44_17]OGX04184.1 MAG: chorismate mutase [Omnitrophica bacterium RIFCSPLOWO2_02_FULL_44_11]
MTLEAIRKKIDKLDSKIIEFLNDRTKLVLEIGQLKERQGAQPYAPDRESAVYRKIEALSKGPLPKDAVKAIYREIMSASISLEKPISVAYLGPEATFSHLASISKFGSSVNYVPCMSIAEVFQEVDRNHVDYGVIPVENSIEGAVSYSLDMFIDSELTICSEIMFEISHNLMAKCKMNEIKRIYSVPQVFGQCRYWLERNLPHAELIETASTTQAAQRAEQEDHAAAIASKLAATLYNLDILDEGIEDLSHNVTRFLVVGRNFPSPTKHDKTSIVVSIKDKVGALYDMLKPIRVNRINMTKIESRPSKKKAWDYYFFIDIEGHIQEPRIKKTIKQIEKQVRYLKVLGSYPFGQHTCR